MTNEEHLEEILMEAHQLKIEKDVFRLAGELSRENPKMNMVDLFESSLQRIKNNGIISNTPSQEI
jgi:hypothetical protein